MSVHIILNECLSFQHRYQDEVERSLIGPGGAYARPSSRAQANQRERERYRQVPQESLFLYLAQPSSRHRGAASMAPAGEDFYDYKKENKTIVEGLRKINMFKHIFCAMSRSALLPGLRTGDTSGL